MSVRDMKDPNPSSVFCRGQVWYWDDPLYGTKGNQDVSIGEGTLRYSRYVIIAQDIDSIDRKTILVIPCSSKTHSTTDVQIPISHLFAEKLSYARCNMLMPVHKTTLHHYVCTLQDDTMACIDGMLLRLLMPRVTNKFNDGALEALFNVNMNEASDRFHEYFIKIDEVLTKFCAIELEQTGESSHRISVQNLMDRFGKFCMMQGVDPVDDVAEFVYRITRVLHACDIGSPRMKLLRQSALSNGVITGVKFINEINEDLVVATCDNKVDPPADQDDFYKSVPEPTGPVEEVKNVWNIERKMQFVKRDEELNDFHALAAEYGITLPTARTYHSRFKADVRKYLEAHPDEAPKEESTKQEAQETNSQSVAPHWDTDKRVEFMTKWYDRSDSDVADQYRLSVSMARKMSQEFLYDREVMNEVGQQMKPLEIPKYNDLRHIDRAVSQYSNFIYKYMMKARDNHELDLSVRGKSDIFYKKLSSAIYYSILMYLGVKVKDNGEIRVPDIDETSCDLRTWHFVTKVMTDPDIYGDTDDIELLHERYRTKYELEPGISASWLKVLRTKLNRGARVYGSDLEKIVMLINRIAVRVI